MTFKEFLMELKALKLVWTVDSWGNLRALCGDKRHCPISAVTGDYRDFGFPEDAGAELGLSLKVVERIVRASDGDVPTSSFTRHRLLEACGL